jgi:hypothetical protein
LNPWSHRPEAWQDPKTGNTYWILPKAALIPGHYYTGRCRNARIARWDGEQFWYWRVKFGDRFTEPINHPEDDNGFDLFLPERYAFGPEEGIPLERR